MELNKKLLKVLKKTFKKSKFQNNLSKLRLSSIKEWDSLKHFHLLLEIEKEFNLRFSSDVFSKIKTMEDIISTIKENEEKKKRVK